MSKLHEGYIICCFGDIFYYNLTYRLIDCIRKYDFRPICVLTDNPKLINTGFDNIIIKEFNYLNHTHKNIDNKNSWNKYGLIPKIYQSLYSPFEVTCFLDCDVIFYDDEFLKFWDLYYKSQKDVLVPGCCDINNKSPSNWHWGHVNEIINNLGFNIPGVLSSLIIYNQNLKKWINESIIFILDNISKIGCKPYFNGGFPDEIIYSILFGKYGVQTDNELHTLWTQDKHWNSCDKNIFVAKCDGFSYLTPFDFYNSINLGNSEPYNGDIDVVKYFMSVYPNRNRTYIDVGAHIGVTTCAYSRFFNTVYSYEATQTNFYYLKQNIVINSLKNVIAKNIGIYNKNCKGNIFKHEENNSGTYYFKIEGTQQITENVVESNIECTTIDDECELNNIADVDFIKIDTEGSELFILEGAKNTIVKYKPLIQIAVNGLNDSLYSVPSSLIVSFLISIGYKLFANKGANLFFSSE